MESIGRLQKEVQPMPTLEKTALPVAKTTGRPMLRGAFDLFDELRDEMMEFWEKPFPFMLPFGRPRHLGKTTAAWAPRLDVYEKEGELIVKADLPGLKKENVKVEYMEGDLVLTGERREEKEVREENLYRAERAFGTFYRRLPLSFAPDPALIVAKFGDGVLEVRIPIPVEHKPEVKTIPIG
jgi:HSP20 family molecular chaperone IbpA